MDWARLHIGKATASQLGQLLTTKFEMRDGEMPKTYLYEKAAEAYRGEPLPGFSSWDTEQGRILEEEARPWASLVLDTDIDTVGFIESEDGRSGCSPDGLIGEDGGLEIKAPGAPVHVKYLLTDALPKEYAAQVHGSLYVTGRKWWKFISYRRGFPNLIVHVERDEEICSKIGEAIAKFAKDFDAAMEKLRSFQ